MKCEPLWLSDIRSLPKLGAPLNDHIKTDIAIIGAGFIGLWTSIWLKQLDPSLHVAIFDKGQAGHGASSRNGGFVMTWWPKIGRLIEIAGEDDARWLADETTRNVTDMETFLRDEQVDVEFELGGWLWTATSPAHRGAWRAVVEKTRALGRNGIFAEITADELRRRTGSSAHLDGILERVNGKVHPARLSYGLATIARRLGVEIYEDAPVDSITPGAKVELSIRGRKILAEKAVVASNIAATSMPELARFMVLVTSAIVATKAVPERLAEIGWTGGETITDSQSRINYYRTTRSGRIVYGMGVARLSYGNRLTADVYADQSGIGITEQNFRRVYPNLSDVALDFGWSGPIDRTYDGLPLIGHFPRSRNVVYGVGWSGNGVGPSRVGGRILAGLVLGRVERWTQNAFVGRIGRKFPPEPMRFLAGSAVRHAIARKDDDEMAGRQVSALHRTLAKLAPAGTEDKG